MLLPAGSLCVLSAAADRHAAPVRLPGLLCHCVHQLWSASPPGMILTAVTSLVYPTAGECGLDVMTVSTTAAQWCRCGICTGPSATLETELLIS